MTDEWHTAPLGEITQFINGLWKGEDPPFVHVGVIRNTNFTKDGALDDSDIAYLEVETKKFQKRRLQFGDVILEKSGGGPKQPVGRVVLFDKTEGHFSFSNFTAAIRVVDPTALDSRFLHKYLHWVYVSGRTETMQSHSTGIRNLNGDAYKAIEVTYPSLHEQRRIVAFLDEAFEAIATAKANAEKNLQNARKLFQVQRDAVFAAGRESWSSQPLGAIAEVQSGGTPPVSTKAFWGGDIPWYSSGELNSMKTRDPERLITEAGLAGSNAKLFPTGSLLIGMYDTAALKMSIADRPAAFNQAIAGVKPNPKVSMEFLLHAINFRKPELLDLRRGVRQKNLSLGKIKEFMVPVPGPQVQVEIVRQLRTSQELSHRLNTVYERKLAALDELKHSLLRQAFTGGLSQSNDRPPQARGLQMCTQ